jgi:hypothetical protein
VSERAFRAVVAAVLVGALALAAVVAFALLQGPAPGPVPTTRPSTFPTTAAPATASPAPTPTPQLVFDEIGVTAVASVARGGVSAPTLMLRFTESGVAAIPDAAGSFTVTLADSAGAATLTFTGTPSIDAPDSLGVSAELVAGNVLRISIVASDTLNVEPMTVTGLGIGASDEAAIGPMRAVVGDFTGSFAAGVANETLPSPGTVVAAP